MAALLLTQGRPQVARYEQLVIYIYIRNIHKSVKSKNVSLYAENCSIGNDEKSILGYIMYMYTCYAYLKILQKPEWLYYYESCVVIYGLLTNETIWMAEYCN